MMCLGRFCIANIFLTKINNVQKVTLLLELMIKSDSNSGDGEEFCECAFYICDNCFMIRTKCLNAHIAPKILKKCSYLLKNMCMPEK